MAASLRRPKTPSSLPERVSAHPGALDGVLAAENCQLRQRHTLPIVTNAMQLAPTGFTLPLKVEVHVGRTWADCK
jgi:hypothetical protein